MEKNYYKLFALLVMLINISVFSQVNPDLEMTQGNGDATNGPTTTTQVTFSKNTDNSPTGGSTYSAYNIAGGITATYTLQNFVSTYQGTTISGGNSVSIGQAGAAAGPKYVQFTTGAAGNSVFTSSTTSTGTGLITDGTATTNNYGVNFKAYTSKLAAATVPRNGRVKLAEMRVVFSRAVNNPIIHFAGLGGAVGASGFSAGFTLNTALSTATAASITRVSGNTAFVVSGLSIDNNASPMTAAGAGMASGSVRINGLNITTVVFDVYMKGDGTGTNTTWGDGSNTDTAGDAYAIAFTLSESDLQVTKTVNQSISAPGSTRVFTITAANNGASNNTSVSVTDLLPSGYTFVSSAPSVGTYNSTTGLWSVGNLNDAATATLMLTATVNPTGNYSNNAVVSTTSGMNDPNTANNTATVAINLDTDGDGISNDSDLDSDNDGILDIDECTESVVNQPFSSADGTTVSFSAPAADLGFIFDVYTLDNSFNLNINGVSLATNEIQFQSNQTDNIRFVDGSRYGIGGVPEIYAMTGNATNPLIRIVIQKNGSINLYGSKSSNGPLFPLELYGGNSLNTITWNQTGSNSIVLSQIVVGATHITGNGNGVKSGFCDPDGDGISNQLDLDSDGDGCFDALEGDENVTLNQLNANGSINTTANGGINSNGVPNLVNIGGAADIGGDIGQGIGDSQNALINACYCYKKPVLDAGVTVPTKHGITALNRANSGTTDWPIVRQSAWTVREARTKGFVVNKVAFSDADANPATPMTPIGIDAADFVEGMMVYDTTNNCLKIYNGTVWNCYITQACPQ